MEQSEKIRTGLKARKRSHHRSSRWGFTLVTSAVPLYLFKYSTFSSGQFSFFFVLDKVGLQWLQLWVLERFSWCGYMKGGLPEWGPALPILMVISSESGRGNEGSSSFSFISLDSGGSTKAKWGSAPTPCEKRERWKMFESVKYTLTYTWHQAFIVLSHSTSWSDI